MILKKLTMRLRAVMGTGYASKKRIKAYRSLQRELKKLTQKKGKK